MRLYLLGWRPKTHLKTGEKCSKRAANKGRNFLEAQKEGNLGKKNSQSRLSMGAKSYEMHNKLKSFWRQQ